MVENGDGQEEIDREISRSPISEENKALAADVFNAMDSNHDGMISKEEVLEWWKNNYAKLNARNLFGQLDKDENNEISFDEWMAYWSTFKNKGYSDSDIADELEFLKEKGPWAIY